MLLTIEMDKTIVWISALGLASATGYLRIAADKHYFSDVFVGAIVGSLIGNTMFDKLTRKYQRILCLEHILLIYIIIHRVLEYLSHCNLSHL